ncbi:ribosome small subunit-dependent GTPase A [Paenibacillus koleovorans]|uniref:ribosome small subunit-dependent GTPase A n=1 Tax=Paenibacillus koleovorans TaxID=121608 RepID=UPI000FDA7CC3|nr:ribosome small subunit-dependent GTPase A [Paenibacillus koleovorans]
MPSGIIVKALSGYYYVQPDEPAGAGSVQCRARGIFKKKGISPLVGDHALYELTENGEGTVDEIKPRTTELIRPPIANVDQAVLVFSLTEPGLNLQLLDKFLVHTEQARLETVICLTKVDLLQDRESGELAGGMNLDAVRRLYESFGYRVIVTSKRTQEGLEAVRDALAGRISVFSGQSGVGKSSMLNAIVPGLKLETNEISAKLGRGKHTTRHVELFPLEAGGFVADTPGFSQLDFLELEPEQLSGCFAEFRGYSAGCKFRGCLHQQEPGCLVLQALDEGAIAPSRYKHYTAFLTEMKERKRRY